MLSKLGYIERSDGWQHPIRKVIFLGGFIDRGPEQVKTISIAKTMVDNQHALAVMGNHEFNAIGLSRGLHLISSAPENTLGRTPQKTIISIRHS